MITVLMLSLDTALVTQPLGDSRQRHLAYAARAGKLTIVVYTPPGMGGAVDVSPQLTLIPMTTRAVAAFATPTSCATSRSFRNSERGE